ncbi:uncharacterized protein LOC133198660 isoform X1 [Saccostrea echinata]|uniref:uncharacterized protein LOC133198660 isoform X1 n=1 Tax=Saccostrea echinata TaxID=191078 RepID=UPI002A80E3D7|nr:uncharacterized protein LOC133198660 isoform X1 [Saccostrea echinata]
MLASIWATLLSLWFWVVLADELLAAGTGCSSNPCLNNGTCVPAFFRCQCPEGHAEISTDSRSSLGGFTSGFLSGMSAMLFLFVTVCGSMYLARKYEEHKELKRMRKRQEVLQIQENGHN